MTYRKSVLRVLLISVMVLVAANLTLLPAARAATFTVDTTHDTVDANPGDGVCADASGDCSLRAAIMEANALAGVDVVTLSSGTYTLAIATTYENAAMDGDLDITADLTINGAGAGNTRVDGGGIDRVFHIPVPGVSVEIYNVTIQNGYRDANACGEDGGVSGGGVHSSGDVLLDHCVVRDNQTHDGASYGSAGGIRVFDGTMTLVACAVVNNATNDAGGGIKNDDSTLILINTTVSGNSSDDYTGGVHTGCFATTTFDQCTIVNNTSNDPWPEHAGGISGNGSVTLTNTIVANNTAGVGDRNDCSGTLISQGYNLIEDEGSCTITGDTTGNITGQDPSLGPLADNGGDTLTHALRESSPAINRIPVTRCTQVVDQRGDVRPSGSGCDVGAYESRPFAPVPTLSEWGLMAFAVLMAGCALRKLRQHGVAI